MRFCWVFLKILFFGLRRRVSELLGEEGEMMGPVDDDGVEDGADSESRRTLA
jgi:hypothetical protein